MKTTMMRLGLVLAALAAAAAGPARAEQFDLECKGSFTHGYALDERAPDRAIGKEYDYSAHIRIDTGRGLYCYNDCQVVWRFTAASPGRMESHTVGVDKPAYSTVPGENGLYGTYLRADIVIDLKNGVLRADYVYLPPEGSRQPLYNRVTAACARQPFSGMPEF